jgi:3'5'-cyclic nucleotide phosphodiesterase
VIFFSVIQPPRLCKTLFPSHQHMHSFICFNTMRHESLDVLGSLNVDQRKRARSNIIALILGTDLQQHFEILCRFKGRFLDPVKADAPAHDDNGGVLLQMQIALKVRP